MRQLGVEIVSIRGPKLNPWVDILGRVAGNSEARSDDAFAPREFSPSGQGRGGVSKWDGVWWGGRMRSGRVGWVECVFFVWEGSGEGGQMGFPGLFRGPAGIPP